MGPLAIFCLLIITFFVGSRGGSVTNDKRRHGTSPGSAESLNEHAPNSGRLPRHGDSRRERHNVKQTVGVKPPSISSGSSPTDKKVAWDTNIRISTILRDSFTEQEWTKDEDADANESRHPLAQSQRSTRQMLKMGPGDGKDVQQVRMYGARE